MSDERDPQATNDGEDFPSVFTLTLNVSRSALLALFRALAVCALSVAIILALTLQPHAFLQEAAVIACIDLVRQLLQARGKKAS